MAANTLSGQVHLDSVLPRLQNLNGAAPLTTTAKTLPFTLTSSLDTTNNVTGSVTPGMPNSSADSSLVLSSDAIILAVVLVVVLVFGASLTAIWYVKARRRKAQKTNACVLPGVLSLGGSTESIESRMSPVTLCNPSLENAKEVVSPMAAASTPEWLIQETLGAEPSSPTEPVPPSLPGRSSLPPVKLSRSNTFSQGSLDVVLKRSSLYASNNDNNAKLGTSQLNQSAKYTLNLDRKLRRRKSLWRHLQGAQSDFSDDKVKRAARELFSTPNQPEVAFQGSMDDFRIAVSVSSSFPVRHMTNILDGDDQGDQYPKWPQPSPRSVVDPDYSLPFDFDRSVLAGRSCGSSSSSSGEVNCMDSTQSHYAQAGPQWQWQSGPRGSRTSFRRESVLLASRASIPESGQFGAHDNCVCVVGTSPQRGHVCDDSFGYLRSVDIVSQASECLQMDPLAPSLPTAPRPSQAFAFNSPDYHELYMEGEYIGEVLAPECQYSTVVKMTHRHSLCSKLQHIANEAGFLGLSEWSAGRHPVDNITEGTNERKPRASTLPGPIESTPCSSTVPGDGQPTDTTPNVPTYARPIARSSAVKTDTQLNQVEIDEEPTDEIVDIPKYIKYRAAAPSHRSRSSTMDTQRYATTRKNWTRKPPATRIRTSTLTLGRRDSFIRHDQKGMKMHANSWGAWDPDFDRRYTEEQGTGNEYAEPLTRRNVKRPVADNTSMILDTLDSWTADDDSFAEG